MGGLTIFVVVFGSYKLYRRKIRYVGQALSPLLIV